MGSIGNTKLQIPQGATLLQEAKALKGEELSNAIIRADSLGSYYREDKRQKRGYITQIANNMWSDNPRDSDEISNNLDVMYIVRGISKYSEESIRLARYWEDKLYNEGKR